jgi:hypothetical protein
MAAQAKTMRVLLLAGVSFVALNVGAPRPQAADIPRMITKAPVYPSYWDWWVEGGAFWTAGGGVNFGDPVPIGKPGVGPEVAIGFDHRWGDGWHISAQGRYGWASGGAPASFSFQSAPAAPFSFTNGTNTDHKETHWLADFMVGRDLGVGGNIQVKAGVRVADLTAKTTASIAGGTQTAPPTPMIIGKFAATPEQKSSFLGFGPRVALEGHVPMQRSWTIDWGAGGGVLFGDRKVDLTGGSVSAVHFPNLSSSNRATVINLDGLLGLSYWFSTASRLSLSYRVDAYLKGLTTFNATGTGTENVNRIYHGPMLRFTYRQ